MRLIADVHGAVASLAAVSAVPGPLLVLGDLINFIDYRTHEGIISEVSGTEFVREMVRLRTEGDLEAAARLWYETRKGREEELERAYDDLIENAYIEICAALAGPADAYVTYGNVDRPELMAEYLPGNAHFVDGEVVEFDHLRVGFAGGGITSIGTPGEVSEDQMAAKLDGLGRVDVLCTHVPAAIETVATDVIGGRVKGSVAVREYLETARPAYHYFGDVHQPQAVVWRHGDTVCHNVGYFRATGKAVHHR